MPTEREDFNLVWSGAIPPAPISVASSRWNTGWEIESPPSEEMDYVQYVMSVQSLYLVERGIARWETGIEYQLGAVVFASDDEYYISLSTVQDVDPVNDIAFVNWAPLASRSGVRGEIKMFDGSPDELVAMQASGWRICDGSNDTPDLVDHFIKGTATHSEIGILGGSTTQKPNLYINLTTNTAGMHSHITYTPSFSIQLTHLPSHTHNINHDHANHNVTNGGAHYHIVAGEAYTNARYGLGSTSKTYYGYRGSGNRNTEPSTTHDGSHTHSIAIPNFTGYTGYTGSTNGHTHPSRQSDLGGGHNHGVNNTFTPTPYDNNPSYYDIIFLKFIPY